MRKQKYFEYLQSVEWYVKRNAKLWIANYKCQLCNKKESHLHVHHTTYKNVGNERPEDLIVLCKACHEKFHNI